MEPHKIKALADHYQLDHSFAADEASNTHHAGGDHHAIEYNLAHWSHMQQQQASNPSY